MIDRILLSISPYSEHIVELCQQRALEGHCGRKLLSSFGGPAESGCCGCGDFRWSTSCLVPRTRRFLGDLVGLSWPCDNLPWPLLRREWQLVASCWWTFPACTGTGSLCRSLGCLAVLVLLCMSTHLLAGHLYHTHTTEGRFLLAQQLQTICDLDKPVIFCLPSGLNYTFPSKV